MTLEPDPDHAGVGKGNMLTHFCAKLFPVIAISLFVVGCGSTKSQSVVDPQLGNDFTNLLNWEFKDVIINGASFRYDTLTSISTGPSGKATATVTNNTFIITQTLGQVTLTTVSGDVITVNPDGSFTTTPPPLSHP
jgi:hypothetical protein